MRRSFFVRFIVDISEKIIESYCSIHWLSSCAYSGTPLKTFLNPNEPID
jgi:hypothetical protein